MARSTFWEKIKGFGGKVKDFAVKAEDAPSDAQTYINDWVAGLNIPALDTNVKVDKTVWLAIAGVALFVWYLFKRKKKGG